MTTKGPDGFPKQGKGRGKPLPREAGKEGLEDCWSDVPLNPPKPRGLVGLYIWKCAEQDMASRHVLGSIAELEPSEEEQRWAEHSE